MSEEFEYNLYCAVCEHETDVVVYNEEEKPVFCPMCGSEAEVSSD